MEEEPLISTQEQKVDFYGDEIATAHSVNVIERRYIGFYSDRIELILADVRNIVRLYIPVRPICKYLGLSWSGQLERIKRHPVLSREIILIYVKEKGRTSGIPAKMCLPIIDSN
jgi:hypothetical protein